MAVPFVLQDTKYHGASECAVGTNVVVSQNAFLGASDAFHGVDAVLVEGVGAEFYPVVV